MEPLYFSSRHLLSKTSIAWNCSGGSRGEGGGGGGGGLGGCNRPKGLRPVDRRVALPREVSNGARPAKPSERALVHVTRDMLRNFENKGVGSIFR